MWTQKQTSNSRKNVVIKHFAPKSVTLSLDISRFEFLKQHSLKTVSHSSDFLTDCPVFWFQKLCCSENYFRDCQQKWILKNCAKKWALTISRNFKMLTRDEVGNFFHNSFYSSLSYADSVKITKFYSHDFLTKILSNQQLLIRHSHSVAAFGRRF